MALLKQLTDAQARLDTAVTALLAKVDALKALPQGGATEAEQQLIADDLNLKAQALETATQ
jgi:CobQ-like glutamine amidotransferase family enzyme